MSIEKYFVAEETTCTVKMDGREITSGDYVAVLSKDNGDAGIYYNTDCITLGLAIKMIAKAFVDNYSKLTDEEKSMVLETLGDGFDSVPQDLSNQEVAQ